MSANVETMMYVREKPWHELGTMVQEAPTSADALRLAGLDWQVKQRPIYHQDGTVIPGWKENYRETDGASFGIVTNRYAICQNAEAFDFTDALVGNGARYETAGSLRGGKTIWLLAKLDGTKKILGDDFENYLCFSNSHDGTKAIRCCITPIRVVCNNTLNVAMDTAERMWSTKHTGNIQAKLAEAEHVLFKANQYLEAYGTYAEQLANTPLLQDDLELMLKYLFPVADDASDRSKANAQRMRQEFMFCYFMPDIEKFRGTQWGALNAMSDLIGHTDPLRKQKDYKASRWEKIMGGHQLMDNLMNLMKVTK